MAKDDGADRRAQAAAARAEAEGLARKERRIKVLGGAAVLVVVVGIVLAGYLGAKSSEPQADANAKQPIGTLADTFGYPVKAVDDSKSTLTIYEDPQCPICKLFETAYGPTIEQFVSNGTINVVYQMATFIDDNLPQSNQASRRAVAAMGCAIDEGVGFPYHKLVYANQPATEGEGYSDELLRGLASKAGLSGAKLTSFEKCFDAGTYLGWADNLNQYFRDSGIQGTPTLQLDGTTLPDSALTNVKTLTDYINQNKK